MLLYNGVQSLDATEYSVPIGLESYHLDYAIYRLSMTSILPLSPLSFPTSNTVCSVVFDFAKHD